MNRQLDIPLEPRVHARHDDPRTSKAAAGQLGDAFTSLCNRLLAALREQPSTAGELADRLELDVWQVNKRLPDLKEAGLAETTGAERKWWKSQRQQREWRAL